eukprot:417173-Pelagomonas_calceolata.AAC.1
MRRLWLELHAKKVWDFTAGQCKKPRAEAPGQCRKAMAGAPATLPSHSIEPWQQQEDWSATCVSCRCGRAECDCGDALIVFWGVWHLRHLRMEEREAPR